MPNKVTQWQIVAVRQNAAGDGFLLRYRLRVEAGMAGDLAEGWYVANVPIQNIRPHDPVQDGTVSPDSVMETDFATREERQAAFEAWRQSQG